MAEASRARRDDKAMREREERESHELSKLKQNEYNLRVSAAKVYKLEASRRAKAEKAHREGKANPNPNPQPQP